MTTRTTELTDGRILLRPLTIADATVHLAGEDEEQVRWLSGQSATAQRVRAWISENERQWRTGGQRRNFGVLDVDSDVLIGNIEAQFAHPELAEGEVNVSYATFPTWRGRGIATRAVGLLVAWLRTFPAVHTAVIRTHPDNAPSRAVAQSAGFVDLGMQIESDGAAFWRFSRRIRIQRQNHTIRSRR